MKKMFIIGGIILTGLVGVGIWFFFFQEPPGPVSYEGIVTIYVDDPLETKNHIDAFLTQRGFATASSSPHINGRMKLIFSLPFLYMNALTALLREEATNNIIFGEKTLYGAFEFEPKAPMIVDVELYLTPVSTLQQ